MTERELCPTCLRPLAVGRFGQDVERKRAQLGLSLREAAKKANLTFTTLSRIENGKVPSLVSFARLADWLELTPDDIAAYIHEFTEQRRGEL